MLMVAFKQVGQGLRLIEEPVAGPSCQERPELARGAAILLSLRVPYLIGRVVIRLLLADPGRFWRPTFPRSLCCLAADRCFNGIKIGGLHAIVTILRYEQMQVL